MSKSLISNSTAGAFSARSVASSRSLRDNPIKVYNGLATIDSAEDTVYTDIALPTGSVVIYLSVTNGTTDELKDTYVLQRSTSTTTIGSFDISDESTLPLYASGISSIIDPYVVLTRTAGTTDVTGNTAKVTLVVANP